MAKLLRGEIYWADLNPVIGHEQAGMRPVLIISNNIFNERSGTVIALALTSQFQKAEFPLTFELTDPNLPKRSWVKISQIRTLSVLRIKDKIGEIKQEDISRIIEGLNEIISD
ncbi:MAG: type II toxin-antitoxin system PemK/MazF family toxin [Actinobacteria bacterium]|nr:type II toxin-antitoxin system PemK/MazF family toxin [Actinomycetota bacterium]